MSPRSRVRTCSEERPLRKQCKKPMVFECFQERSKHTSGPPQRAPRDAPETPKHAPGLPRKPHWMPKRPPGGSRERRAPRSSHAREPVPPLRPRKHYKNQWIFKVFKNASNSLRDAPKAPKHSPETPKEHLTRQRMYQWEPTIPPRSSHEPEKPRADMFRRTSTPKTVQKANGF